MKKKRILTGDRPSGKLHLGHYVGSLQNRVKMQNSHEQYVMIADLQSLTDESFKSENILEIMKDYISVGIDPEKTTFLLQSQINSLYELTFYYMNLVTLGRLERNPTIKEEILQKGYKDSIKAGFLCYPVSQSADITGIQADVVPAGKDQIPMIEQTNEIVRKFSQQYNSNCLREAEILLSDQPKLVGIDGKSKASKSLNNAIYLSDNEKTLREKVFSMYTDPDHIHVHQPGKIEGNVVFSYLDSFYEDKEHLSELKENYKKGGLGDIKIKQILFESLRAFLTPIQNIRLQLKDEDMISILKNGTYNANIEYEKTIQEVRKSIGIYSFD
ncbi:tryptophan--tRNA ligase [Candidatus Nesciobacter abundans]|uniref:tryptophan--tRNA ligase n=1 Tax=Candidatus Nesciobacter abundans TaxID=2601668 RepID=UPI001CA3FA1A